MSWKPLLILTPVVLVLFVSAGTLRSQIRARVDLVVVPVSVRDNNGFLITGLERDDFTVLEDGKPQKIINFSRTHSLCRPRSSSTMASMASN